MRRFRARVKGIVQGVGFRYYVIRKAIAYHLHGYVKNCPDGDVEVEAEGDEENLKMLLEDLEKGPSLSSVTGVDVEWLENERGFQDFTLRW